MLNRPSIKRECKIVGWYVQNAVRQQSECFFDWRVVEGDYNFDLRANTIVGDRRLWIEFPLWDQTRDFEELDWFPKNMARIGEIAEWFLKQRAEVNSAPPSS